MNIKMNLGGEVAPGFEKVKEAFLSNWDGYEVGAGYCVVLGGKTVVDLWGGFQDKHLTRPWERNTLVNVYSTTKGMTSLAPMATLKSPIRGRVKIPQRQICKI